MGLVKNFFSWIASAISEAAYRPRSDFKVQRVSGITRVVADLERVSRFYCEGLGFHQVERRAMDTNLVAALGAGEATEIVLQLGNHLLTLAEFAQPGRSYPSPRASNDPWFQHIAIVVDDMDKAYAHLRSRLDWIPVSSGGPQTLPPENGKVRAFKFRDPDGHPVELLWFPPGHRQAASHESAASPLFIRIDHSAITVRSTTMSLRFYSALGFKLVSQTLNRGDAQDHLDGLEKAWVTVSALHPPAGSAGLELLTYHPPNLHPSIRKPNDIATDWVTLEATPAPLWATILRDPDQHIFIIAGCEP